ncbi:MAG: glycosyltransferase family 4 protein [Actinomycetota bacterium]
MASGLVAFIVAIVSTPIVIAVLRRSAVMDVPNARSSHDKPVVRGGGISIGIATLTGWAISATELGIWSLAMGIVVAGVALGSIGLAEDLRGVSAWTRFLLQSAAAALSAAWLLRDLSGPSWWRIIFAIGTLVWIVAYTNAFNFMDGINGISVAQSAIAGITWALIGSIYDVPAMLLAGAALAGAVLGFAPFNFPRASIFPGDVGSYLIGGWQAAIVVIGMRSGLAPEMVIAPAAIYLADTGWTLSLRVRRGEVWHEPHRDHAYQRLIRHGWSHPRTTALVAICVAACSAIGFAAPAGLGARILADGALLCVLIVYLAFPRIVTQRAGMAADRSR